MCVCSAQNIAVTGFILRCYWLILGLIGVPWVHGISGGSCLVGEFDSQVRCLLKEEMLTQAEIANLSVVFQDLQNTLQTRWPGSKVYPLGSFMTGLASKSSDADCMVIIPRHHITEERQLILEAAHLLTQHPELYDQVRPKVKPGRRIALLKFIYIPTRRNCDVNFISNIALQNTKMMAYYFELDDKFLALAAILKLWVKVQGLKDSDAIASNSLNLLIIFYLQQEKLAPPFVLLQKHLIRCPEGDWETSFNKIHYNNTKMVDLYQLLGGFFKYYSDFKFDEYVVSPLVGRPIHRRAFKNIESLPEELSLYKKYMKKPNSRPLALNTKLCVQDAIEQRRNTANVDEEKANKFISLVKFAATMFKFVPKNKFLAALLNVSTGLDQKSRLVGIIK